MTKVRIRREQDVKVTAGLESVVRLLEQGVNETVVVARMPGPVGDIERLAWKVRRIGDDHVQQPMRRQRREQIRAYCRDRFAIAVRAGVVRRGPCRDWVDVERYHAGGTGAGGGEREDARSGAHI